MGDEGSGLAPPLDQTCAHQSGQRLADLQRRALHVDAHRHRQVCDRARRLVEDVLALADLVADLREREEQILSSLDSLIVDARVGADPGGERVNLLRRHPGSRAG